MSVTRPIHDEDYSQHFNVAHTFPWGLGLTVTHFQRRDVALTETHKRFILLYP